MKSTHPFKPFIPIKADKLIIGTIPPPRFCLKDRKLYPEDVRFYYGSRDNAFWTIIEKIFDFDFEFKNSEKAINERKNALKELGIGITDIVDQCNHSNDFASDTDLKNLDYKDLGKLLHEHPKIKTLIYTSEFVKNQINTLFRTYHSIDKRNNKIQSIKINGTEYGVRILYSPSPNALRNLGENGSQKRERQYKDFLS